MASRDSQFRLLRTFSITSAVLSLLLTVGVVVVNDQHQTTTLLRSAEKENVSLARAFANAIWSRHGQYLSSARNISGDALRALPETAALDQDFRMLANDLQVLKVKIYNPEGLTLYSSDRAQIGQDYSGNKGFRATLRTGEPSSQTSRRQTFQAFSKKRTKVDLAETYVPILDGAGTVVSIFELYGDITPEVAALRSSLQSTAATIVAVAAGIYFAFLLIVWRGELSIRKQASEILASRAEVLTVNARLEASLANMPQGLCLFDANKCLVASNDRFREIYNLPAELAAPGTSLEALLQYQSRQGVTTQLTLEDNLKEMPSLLRQTAVTSEGRTISIHRSPLSDGGWVATHEDVTEDRQRERLFADKATELELINSRFDAALNYMHHGISMFDDEKRLVVWNARYAEMFGFPSDYLEVGMHVNEIAADLVAWGVLKGGQNKASVELKVAAMDELALDSSWVEKLSDGRSILLSRQPMGYGGWLATSEDITERLRVEAEIVHLAHNDPLTSLANRAAFGMRLEEACKRANRYGTPVTVMMLDLDKFKHVNDTLGHPAGDKLLVEVAHRLRATLRETDILARLGGDEFAIIQEGGDSQHEGAVALALRIIRSITEPFDLDGNEAKIGTSIGMALAPEHGVDAADLLKKADLALYEVKSAGRNDFRIFQQSMLDAVHSQHSSELLLRRAIESEELELHYQPVIDARTNEVCGAEALVRWRHPEKGLIGPDQFIPLAESTGLIVPLGNWVLQRACADATTWPAHTKVSVNISAAQLKDASLFDVILCTLVETGLPPDRLELEITETVLTANQEKHLASIRQLKNLGISVAIDDFGTGYSSMTQLTLFPFDKIKIDKSFTQGFLTRRDHRAIIESTLLLARGLDLKVTAEGIETPEQLRHMQAAGVDFVQGYLLGRPVPLSQFDARSSPMLGEMVA